MTSFADLGPPPAPTKINKMPPGKPPTSSAPPGASPTGPSIPMMGTPMPMTGTPMPMMSSGMGGVPTIGGMGPNVCLNFYPPYGGSCYPCAVPAAATAEEPKKEEKEGEKPKPIYVQGRPTWRLPRMTAKEGDEVKGEPCVIM